MTTQTEFNTCFEWTKQYKDGEFILSNNIKKSTDSECQKVIADLKNTIAGQRATIDCLKIDNKNLLEEIKNQEYLTKKLYENMKIEIDLYFNKYIKLLKSRSWLYRFFGWIYER